LNQFKNFFFYPGSKMTASEEDIEKKGVTAVEPAGDRSTPAYDDVAVGTTQISPLKRSLQGRHMQMIAIGICFVGLHVGLS
jgi:amino acid permease